MNLLLKILCSFLISTSLVAQRQSFSDTLVVHSLRAQTDIRSGNAVGLRLKLTFKLKYDHYRHGSEWPELFGIRAAFFKPDGSIVLAVPGSSYHASKEYIANTGSDDYLPISKKTLFLPYYALRLPAGFHRLHVRVYGFLRDTSVFEEPRIIPVTGMSGLTVSIHKPQTRSFRMVVRDLKVKPHNENGRAWDFGLLNTNEPDLMYRIRIKSAEHTDDRDVSTAIDDAFTGEWTLFSGPVIISSDDRITLSVFDQDVMYDDLIGEISHTLDEWKSISVSKQVLSFGLVLHCIVETEELKE